MMIFFQNLCLSVAINDFTPRWLATVRWLLGVVLALLMMYLGFGNSSIRNSTIEPWTYMFAVCVGVCGLLVVVGCVLMVFGGYLSNSFWQKIAEIQRNSPR